MIAHEVPTVHVEFYMTKIQADAISNYVNSVELLMIPYNKVQMEYE